MIQINTPSKISKSKFLSCLLNVRTLVLAFFLLVTSVASAQFDTLFIRQGVNYKSIQTGNVFVDTINYSWSNFTLNAVNAVATVTLPQNLVPASTPISGAVNFDPNQVASVTYNSGTNVVTVTFVNPLPYGSTGQLTLNLKYLNGSTPNGYAPNIITSINADNNNNSNGVANGPSYDTVSVTAIATNSYYVNKTIKAGGAINNLTIYRIDIGENHSGVGTLNLKNPTFVDTLPKGAQFVTATAFNGSYPPVYNQAKQTITWTWGTPGVDTVLTGYGSAAFVSVNYLTDSSFVLGQNVCNHATLSGSEPVLPGIGTYAGVSASGSVCQGLATPTAGGDCNGGGISAATAWWLDHHVLAGTTGNNFSEGWYNSGNTSLNEIDLSYTIDKSIDFSTIKVNPVYDGFDSAEAATIKVSYFTNLHPSPDTIALGTYQSLSIASGATPSSFTPTLASGEYITQVNFKITGTLQIGSYENLSYKGDVRTTAEKAKDGSAIVEGSYVFPVGSDGGTVIYNRSAGSYTYNGVTKSYSACKDSAEIIAPQPVFYTGTNKSIQNGSSFNASDTVNYQLNTYLGGNANATGVVFSDTLDNRLIYIPSSSTYTYNGTTISVTPDTSRTTDGTNRLILTYNLGTIAPSGDWFRINFNAEIKPGTLPGTIPNAFTLGSDNALFNTVTSPVNLSILSSVALRAYKGQSGCDPTYVYYPTNAVAQAGGPVNYKITLKNLGNVAANNLVMVDVFPFISDYRGSQWYANLASPVTISDPSSTVYYTTVSNPCYTDFNPALNPGGCNTPSWSTTPPVDLTTVRAIKVTRSATIPVLDSIILSWPMVAPLGVPQGLLMDNSLTYQVNRADVGSQLLPATPAKVGMYTNCTNSLGSIGNYVWIDSNRNGQLDEDSSLGLNGVKIYLYNTPDGTYGSGVLVDSTITTTDWTGKPGLYEFVNLQSGQYYVKFPVAYNGDSLTKVVTQTAKTDNNSDANATTGLSEIVTINATGSGQDKNNTTIDAGYTPYGSLGNYVWYDINSNGLQDDGATSGINGVKVYLYELINGSYTKVDSTVTANKNGQPGYYNFVIDSSGLYKVLFPKTVSTKTITTQDATLNTDGNSDADQSTGFSEVVVMNNFVTPGYNKDNPTIDAGYICNVQKPVLSITGSTQLCDKDSAVFTATDTTYGAVYTWYKAGSVFRSGSTTDTLHTTDAGSSPSPAGQYWVTTTDTGGCISHNSDTITVTTVASITGSSSVCMGSTITLHDATSGGTWSSQYDSVATVSSTGVITPVSAGTTTISYVVNNVTNNCSTTKTKVITVDTVPVVKPIVATQSAVCAGGTTNYTASVSDATPNGVWSSSNTADATVSSTGAITGIKAGSVTISYAVTNSYNCKTTVTTPLTINPLPTVASITGTMAVCVNSTTALADATNGGVWSSADNTYATVSASGVVSGIAKGSETIKYTVTDGNTCTYGVSTAVTVNPLPTASISGTTAVCKDATAPSVTFTGANGTAPYTFTYTVNGTSATVTTTSGNSVNVTAPTSTAGSYVYALVSVQDNSSTHCSQVASGSATITVNPLPTATISGTTAVCKGSTAPSITFTGANGTAPYTFTYKIGSGSDLTVTTTSGNSVTVAAPTSTVGTFTYTLESVHDGSSTHCTQAVISQTATVTVNPLPTATISGTTSVCQNVLPGATEPNITFTGANGTAPYTFTYTLNGTTETVTTTSGNSITVAAPVNVPGTFTYSLVSVQDASSTACTQSASGSATVTVRYTPAPPAPSLTSAPQYCIGEVVLKSDTAASAYQWYKDGVAVAGATSQTYNPIATGNYTVVLTSSQGCATQSPSTYAYVYVTKTPMVTINGNGSAQLCGGNSVQLSSSSGYSSYQWYFNGNPIATGLTIMANQAGNYTVVTTDGTGCTSYASTPVDLVNVAAPATPSITGNTTICGSGSTVLTSSVTASNYQWYLNGTAIYGATSSTYAASTVGNYTVTVSNASCSATSATDAIIATKADFTYAATTVSNSPCLSGNSISFTNASVGAASYKWYTDDSLVSSTSTTADTTFTAANTYNVKLVVTSAGGCKDSITKPIYVYSCSVSSGSTGGLESKSLGAAIGERNFNMYKNGKNGPVQYTDAELITAPKRGSFGTFGVGSVSSLAAKMPDQVSTYLPYDKSASVTDLTSITNAIDVRAIDFTQSNLPRAVAFATQTVGGIYSHTKPICDRLKGAQLLNIENVQVQGLTFIRYTIQQPDGGTEYAVSFSAGQKGGRGTYSIQSDWLMPDYASEDTMYNYQLWAASPADVSTMVTQVLSKLKSNMPVAQQYANDLPGAYVSAASRQGTNLNLTVNNRTANTSGYFTLTQKSTENTSISDNVVIPFTVGANGKTTVSIPVGDTYDANISMVFNNTTTDMLYMADGIWGTSSDKNTTVSQFNVTNNSSRVYPENEYALLRDVQVQVTTPSYLSIYKYLKGGAAATNLSAYKSFHFTTATNAEGMNLKVTITKQSVSNWNGQYTYTINNYQDGQTYKLALSDFKSTDSTLPAVLDASDVTSVVYNVINPTGNSVSITTGITNSAFSTENIAYEQSLNVKTVSVSPNPNNGIFKVSFASPSATQLHLNVIDVTGRTISTTLVNATTGKNEVSVNIGQVAKNGVYFVTLQGEGVKYNSQQVLLHK